MSTCHGQGSLKPQSRGSEKLSHKRWEALWGSKWGLVQQLFSQPNDCHGGGRALLMMWWGVNARRGRSLVSCRSIAARPPSSLTKPRQSSSQPPQPLSLDQQVLREVSSFKSPSTDPSLSLSHTLGAALKSPPSYPGSIRVRHALLLKLRTHSPLSEIG